jgi:hypothetical protein
LVRGLSPDADYRFKHTLIQDAAYETLLKSRRQVLHRRVAEALLDHASTAAEPELLAHHFTQAGQIERASEWWGKAGQWSAERSALVEAAEQFTRALAQIATLPATPKLRREQIRLQVALINPLMHLKGYAAPETKAAEERARLLIDQSEALGEPLDDPLLLFSVLYGFWVANYMAFNGQVIRELAAQFLALAQKKGETAPLMIGHRLVEHRSLAMRFGQDVRVATLSYRSLVLWMLSYPARAIADVEHALKDAREIGQAATLMYALQITSWILILCGKYVTANRQLDELVILADEKGSLFRKAGALMSQGWISTLDREATNAVREITTGLAVWRSTGSAIFIPWWLSCLAVAHAELGQFDDACHSMGEAMAAIESTNETLWQAEVNRTAGEIALLSPERDAVRAEAYFDRALSIARQQQAKSWELRAAMSLARLWRSQNKSRQASELLAPIYGWFTEGFDTRDLKEAKALLAELHD